MKTTQSRNLEKNVKRIYKDLEKNKISDAQDTLDFNLEIGGAFFIKALRLGLYSGGIINVNEIENRYNHIKKLNMNNYQKQFEKEFESIRITVNLVFPHLKSLYSDTNAYEKTLKM